MTQAAFSIKRIKAYLLANLFLRFLSLAVALCIWSFTASSRETRIDLVLPVEIRNLPADSQITQPYPTEVSFTLSGPILLINGARRANSSLILSMRDANPGRTQFTHLENNLKLPDGLRVTRVSPAVVEILLKKNTVINPEGEDQ